MKIILNENVDNLGAVGDVVKVKNGYARNYLIPNGLAAVATDASIRAVEVKRAKQIAKERELRQQAEELAKKIQGLALVHEAQVGEEGKLFGSVTSVQIQELLAQKGFKMDKKQIMVSQQIRKMGTYDIEVRPYTNVKAFVKLSIVKKAK